MTIDSMEYRVFFAGPGLGQAIHAEISFHGNDGWTYFACYSDGPAGVSCDVTTRSILDIMSGKTEKEIDDSDYLESYETLAEAKKKSHYAPLFTELEKQAKRLRDIEKRMSDPEKTGALPKACLVSRKTR